MLLLGALHGPAELLPISSSGHIALVPWLLGSEYERLAPELRKSFEVALHAGTAAALLLALRREVGEALAELDQRRVALLALSFAPPAAAGLLLEGPIERRLGTPPTIAAGLLAGSALMLAADRAPQVRPHTEAGATDALALGAAQALALIPGISRGGATLAAARWRGFARRDASRLSRHVALPVIAGAAALKAGRLRSRGLPAGSLPLLVLGAGTSFASTLAAHRMIGAVESDRPLAPYALYRTALAGVVIARLATARVRPRDGRQ